MPLRLLQLTDLHLFGDPGGRLLGITTRLSFESVLALALSAPSSPDALILTGDLVQDETPTGYRYLRERLKRTGVPHYCIGGNHDVQSLMREHLGPAALGSVALRRLDRWNLIFLDSIVPGSDGGRLTADQLDQLADLLANDKAPSLICLHHHPAAIGSDWIDRIGVANGAELLALCERHTQVKAILFGHVHQEASARHGNILMLGAPSTCFQFKPGSADFALDDNPPGYRELMLYPDGRLTTRVVRLDQYAEMPLHQAGGY
ncbi:phosphoesterase [Allochromatium palmeri]|uniref:Phosphoesterase n=2 Tax=Allochromatium palmeri TaxID=231048 RepID=A0A6N8ECV2_9GAMM|nr:phosphoesterase [Allochromatium palmeri]